MAKAALVLSIGWLSSLCAQAQTIEGFHGDYGPRGLIRIAIPSISWKVWADPGESLTKAEMKVDGVRVHASYNSASKRLEWTPSTPLSPGEHRISCQVVVEGMLQMKQSWSLTIARNATISMPEASDSLQEILKDINQFRNLQGLSPDVTSPALAAAAKAHSHYLAVNHAFGHYEKPGTPDYVGNGLDDRFNAFGWTRGGYEDVGLESQGTAYDTVRDLFAAPYHRIPFLQPGMVEVGAADEAHRTTIDFSFSSQQGIVCSPMDGSTGQPSAWDGSEIPSPLRFWNSQGPYGYPIMVAGFGADKAIEKGKITLVNSFGRPVACFTSNPESDPELHSALLAIPKAPLVNGKYTARAVLQFIDGTTKKLTWTFTVGPQRS